MSIELENPESALAKVDAAANFVEQMYLAHMIKDEATFKAAHKKAGDMLFKAKLQMEEDESNDLS